MVAPDDQYDRGRQDAAIDRHDRRLEELGRTVADLSSELRMHVTDCTGQRRETKGALDRAETAIAGVQTSIDTLKGLLFKATAFIVLIVVLAAAGVHLPAIVEMLKAAL